LVGLQEGYQTNVQSGSGSEVGVGIGITQILIGLGQGELSTILVMTVLIGVGLEVLGGLFMGIGSVENVSEGNFSLGVGDSSILGLVWDGIGGPPSCGMGSSEDFVFFGGLSIVNWVVVTESVVCVGVRVLWGGGEILLLGIDGDFGSGQIFLIVLGESLDNVLSELPSVEGDDGLWEGNVSGDFYVFNLGGSVGSEQVSSGFVLFIFVMDDFFVFFQHGQINSLDNDVKFEGESVFVFAEVQFVVHNLGNDGAVSDQSEI